jgi:hypothetical protein
MPVRDVGHAGRSPPRRFFGRRLTLTNRVRVDLTAPGKILGDDDPTADARTAIGIDQTRKLLFLAVGERVPQSRMLEILADLGARDGFLLDGGGSSKPNHGI